MWEDQVETPINKKKQNRHDKIICLMSYTHGAVTQPPQLMRRLMMKVFDKLKILRIFRCI